jgi:hypothetical protein
MNLALAIERRESTERSARFAGYRRRNLRKKRIETMRPAQFLVLCAMAFAAVAAIAGLQDRPDATQAELVTGSASVLVSRKTGKPLTCEQIRHLDEVELIADDSYCG